MLHSGKKIRALRDKKSYYIMILFKQFGYYEAAGRDTCVTSIIQYWYYEYYTILVLPVLYNTGITSILPESSSICNTGTDTGKY